MGIVIVYNFAENMTPPNSSARSAWQAQPVRIREWPDRPTRSLEPGGRRTERRRCA
jgi:hypothetical protein